MFVLLFLRGLFLCYYIAILLCVDCCLVAVTTGIVATAAGRFSELPTESFCDFIADIHCVMIGSRTIMANIRTIEGQPQLDKLANPIGQTGRRGRSAAVPKCSNDDKGLLYRRSSRFQIRNPKAEGRIHTWPEDRSSDRISPCSEFRLRCAVSLRFDDACFNRMLTPQRGGRGWVRRRHWPGVCPVCLWKNRQK